MIAKLCVLILVLGASGVGVLSVRQERLITAHETTQARLRARDEALRTSELRARIATLATPNSVRARMELLGPLEPEVSRRVEMIDPELGINIEPRDDAPMSDHDAILGGEDLTTWVLDDGTVVRFVDE
jgi:hypothetical protein